MIDDDLRSCSILAWRRQAGALQISRHGDNCRQWLRLPDMLQTERVYSYSRLGHVLKQVALGISEQPFYTPIMQISTTVRTVRKIYLLEQTT